MTNLAAVAHAVRDTATHPADAPLVDGPLAELIARPHSPAGAAARGALPRAAAGYRILRAWQRALDVAAHAHRLARRLPEDERSLADDLRRAGAAVPAGIAAGNLSFDRAEHRRALVAAQAALARVETLALLAERLALLPPPDVAALLADSADALRLARGLARVAGVPSVVSEPAAGHAGGNPAGHPPARSARRPRRVAYAAPNDVSDAPASR